VVDKLASYFHNVHDPIEGEPEVGEFLMSALHLMSALTGIVEALTDSQTDPTHLWSALKVTDLAGTVSLLYGMLLHQVVTQPKKSDYLQFLKLCNFLFQGCFCSREGKSSRKITR